jgi:hypothetical protein
MIQAGTFDGLDNIRKLYVNLTISAPALFYLLEDSRQRCGLVVGCGLGVVGWLWLWSVYAALFN